MTLPGPPTAKPKSKWPISTKSLLKAKARSLTAPRLKMKIRLTWSN